MCGSYVAYVASASIFNRWQKTFDVTHTAYHVYKQYVYINIRGAYYFKTCSGNEAEQVPEVAQRTPTRACLLTILVATCSYILHTYGRICMQDGR